MHQPERRRRHEAEVTLLWGKFQAGLALKKGRAQHSRSKDSSRKREKKRGRICNEDNNEKACRPIYVKFS